MLRNLVVLGCAGLVLGLSTYSFASPGDVDDDGVPDELDNCLIDSNGPLMETRSTYGW